MISSWEELAAALESAQSTTIYALLTLLLISAASLWLQKRAQPGKVPRPISLTLDILMGLRVVEVLVGASAWTGDASALRLLPPLERSLHLITLLALGWLWMQALEVPARQGAIGLGLSAVLLMAFVLVAQWMGGPATGGFNYTDLDYAWSAACIVALLFGIIQILKIRKIPGLLMFGTLFVGQVIHFTLAEPFGSMPLAVQAAHLAVLPILFALPLTAPAPAKEQLTQAEAEAAAAPLAEVEPEEDLDLPDFFDFEAAENHTSPEAAADELARRTAEDLGADLCVFAVLDGEDLHLVSGYNLLRAAPVEAERISLDQLPQLRAAMQTSEPVRLSAEDRLPELGALSRALRLSFQAYLLALPLTPVAGGPPSAVLLFSLEHNWLQEDELKLQNIAPDLNEKLYSIAGSQPETEEPAATPETFSRQPISIADRGDLQTQLERLEAENEDYRQDVEKLLAHIDELTTAQGAGDGQTLQSNELVQALQLENERLKSSLASLDAGPHAPLDADGLEAQQAREELRLAMEEVARLHTELETAQQGALTAAAVPGGAKMAASQMAVIASVAQELRQPLSSIVGYTDLLLGESIGILGALQRKFLERVRNSTERMSTLIDNLIRIAELDEGGYSATRKPVDLSAVIDDAIGQLRQQLQEKRIALRVDLPQQLPQLNTDRDALQQILYHLLQNADSATPADGSITLRALADHQKELGEYVLVQVSDSGGGIPEADLPRVFSRVYRASNPVIPGVGDTGVGLTIAETLTQALGGRIWVESEAGLGATFSVLLPLNPG
ncbi:MAG: HAMP domain-containing sensor histidine kinase [Anaerolineales bacterium]